MKKLPTQIAEKVYSVLTKFAEAKSDHFSREQFVFHFGVLHDTQDSFKLECMDDAVRTFFCRDGKMWLEGKGSDRVNPILKKLEQEISTEFTFGEFKVTRNAV